MSTTITDVDELQDMELGLTEDYILGNDIDASATSGWNGTEGFLPVGRGATLSSYSRPDSDDFGYAGQGGSWTIYPSDGVYYDKVDEKTSDSDSTYIQATTNGDWALLAHGGLGLSLPSNATGIVVYLRARVRIVISGTASIQGMLNINGTEYLLDSPKSVSSQTYSTKTWTMADYPPSGSGGWSVAEVFSLATAGVGVKVPDAHPDVRITQIWLRVYYDLAPFTGTFDGKGYTISDLYINRPLEDNVGLFGRTEGATIEDVELKDADITGDDYVGALVGWSLSTTTSQCHATGSVTGDDYIGGLIGAFYASTMNNSYSRASVTGDAYVAGLVGFGYSSETITNCYSTGLVTGNSNVGGLLAYSEGTITNCFWDIATSGQATSDGGTGYTTTPMKLFATFDDASWDIDITTTDRNDGYPFLSWEIDESDTIWLIYEYGTGMRSYTIPDILDHKGRPVKNARVQASRVDTHTFVEEELTDEYGSATFDELPNDVDVVFTPTWGGTRTSR